MVGDQFGGNTTAGLFISCNPTLTGEITLGSPLTKNKSTFSDYHYGDPSPYWLVMVGATDNGIFVDTFCGVDYGNYVIGSRLSKN